MAVSGAGGWIPSCGVYLYRGGGLCEVRLLPITQNKPHSCVETDIARAAQRVVAGEIVQVDMRAGNYLAVKHQIERMIDAPHD